MLFRSVHVSFGSRGICAQTVTMRIFALFSTLLFVPFAAWAGQVQDPSLTLPYDTTQDLADVVNIFTDSYNAYRSVPTQVEFWPV